VLPDEVSQLLVGEGLYLLQGKDGHLLYFLVVAFKIVNLEGIDVICQISENGEADFTKAGVLSCIVHV